MHSAILARVDQRHLQPERIELVDPSAGAGERPAAERRGEHQDVKSDVADIGGVALPWLEVARQRRDGIDPAPQQPQHQQGKKIVAERGMPGVVHRTLGARCEMHHPGAMDEKDQDQYRADPVQQDRGPAPNGRRVSGHDGRPPSSSNCRCDLPWHRCRPSERACLAKLTGPLRTAASSHYPRARAYGNATDISRYNLQSAR